MLKSVRAAVALLGAGLVLLVTLGGRTQRFHTSGAEPVWLAGSAVGVLAVHDWVSAEADRTLDAVGLATVFAALAVLVGLLAALRSPRRRFDVGGVLGGLAAVAVWFGAATIAAGFAFDPLLGQLQVASAWQPIIRQGLELTAAAWLVIVIWRLGRIASADSPKRIGGWLVAACVAAVTVLPQRPIFDGANAEQGNPGLLQLATQYVGTALAKKAAPPPPRPPRIDVEATYYRQPELLARVLAGVQQSRPDRPEIYFLAAATFAGEHVFMREVTSAKSIVDERLGTTGRSLLLVNHRETIADTPLANVANLEAALAALGRVMDRDKDLLFLYITSHGSPGEIAVQFPGFSPNQITPARLRQLLDQSGIKHKLIVLSACYSGSFVPALRGPDTVVMTAARPDRTSFGCSDERDWTYFGDAFFNHALRETRSFMDAFDRAKKLVARWEADLKAEPSEPQIAAGDVALAKLDEIARRFNAPAIDRPPAR